MKRFIALLLSASVILALCACGAAPANAAPTVSAAAVSKVPAAEVKPAPTPTPAPTAAPTPAAVSPTPEVCALPTAAPTDKVKEVSPETPAPTETPAPVTAEKEDPAAKYITAIIDDSSKYKDSVKNEYNYHYALPQFNFKGSYFDEQNTVLFDALNPYIEEAYELMDAGLSLLVTDISYDTYLNGDILSLVVKVHFDYEFDNYYVWNINVKTEKPVSNDELFALTDMGHDGSGLADVTAGTVGTYYINNFNLLNDPQWRKCFDDTMNAENLAETKYYLDSDGALQGIIKLHIPVAAGVYNVIIPITR